MLELAFVLAIACLAAVWGADAWRREAQALAGQAAGAWLLEIRDALARMMTRHQDELAQGAAPRDAHGSPAYADAYAPRLDELMRHGHLPGSFPVTSAGGMRVAIRILRGPACPGAGCRLDALAYSAPPVGAWSGREGGSGTGQPGADPATLAAILAGAGGHGGHVDGLAPDHLRGPNFHFPNPPIPGMGRLPVGTVAVWAGLDTAAAWPYVRMRDSRNPDFQGDVTVAGGMHAARRLSTDGHLFVGARARMGDACSPDGLVARAEDGASLSCVAGRWSSPGGFGGVFFVHSFFGCWTPGLVSTANPRTGRCSCPAGHDAIRISRTGDMNGGEGATTGYLCVR
ncbi:prepilin [Achromobacter aloeverae]|uniref:Prepilin n=1 Tax=Achromobacter aloeverae TaxID=1750518 RepID=A0A4Q1HPX5_9BURK|nr:prepilin [Achromobacter aloeverae]RXN92979.1 prepilin [Achromobacter aloeverae]